MTSQQLHHLEVVCWSVFLEAYPDGPPQEMKVRVTIDPWVGGWTLVFKATEGVIQFDVQDEDDESLHTFNRDDIFIAVGR